MEIITFNHRQDLKPAIDAINAKAWPEFMLHGNITNWSSLFTVFARYQILALDDDGKLIAVGHTVPLHWDETEEGLPDDINGIIARALELHNNGGKPNAFSALAAMVAPEYRRQGLSGAIVKRMVELGRAYGASYLIAPVRPGFKERYPDLPFAKYVARKRADGAPLDPWLRVHWRMGATMLRIIPRGLIVSAKVADWQRWTGITFNKTADYVVPGALERVHIDIGKDIGTYNDPNVWMVHRIE
jgi:GNAT superfamily N-acetyltransferase